MSDFGRLWFESEAVEVYQSLQLIRLDLEEHVGIGIGSKFVWTAEE